MSGKITSAYQQFSHRIREQSGTKTTDGLRNNSEVAKKETAEKQPASGLNRQQKAQLRQLRETGTLENLQVILSEDEASLLSKLFPEDQASYDAGARVNKSHQAIKGGLLDTKL